MERIKEWAMIIASFKSVRVLLICSVGDVSGQILRSIEGVQSKLSQKVSELFLQLTVTASIQSSIVLMLVLIINSVDCCTRVQISHFFIKLLTNFNFYSQNIYHLHFQLEQSLRVLVFSNFFSNDQIFQCKIQN